MADDQWHSFRLSGLGEHRDQYIAIAGESLLSHEPQHWETYIERVGPENIRCIFDGEKFVGGLAVYQMGQWYGGKMIESAGLSGVAIHPGHRGSGACGFALAQMLREQHDAGIPLSTLYASTQQMYRKCGYGEAGTQTQYAISLDGLTDSGIGHDRKLPVHRFESPPLKSLQHAAKVRARCSSGQLQRTDGLWERLINPYDGRGSITYLIGDQREPEGYVILRPGVRELGAPQPLVSTDMVANTPASLRRMTALLHDHRSMCDSFHWYGGPTDPYVLFSDRASVNILKQLRWMLRVVNVDAALSKRGYPPRATGTLHLEVHDPIISENSGHWTLSIDGGKGEARRGGVGTLRLDVSWLSSLYSGHLTPTELLQIGKLTSHGAQSDIDAQLDLAAAAFAGPAPWLPELF